MSKTAFWGWELGATSWISDLRGEWVAKKTPRAKAGSDRLSKMEFSGRTTVTNLKKKKIGKDHSLSLDHLP
jgi:hypothetical protein